MGHDMSQSLEDDDTAEPPMEEVELVEGHAEQPNQGVVPAGHQE